MSQQKILDLLKKYCVERFEITDKHYGMSLKYGALKKLYVYDRFISDASEFEALGYGLVMVSKTEEEILYDKALEEVAVSLGNKIDEIDEYLGTPNSLKCILEKQK